MVPLLLVLLGGNVFYYSGMNNNKQNILASGVYVTGVFSMRECRRPARYRYCTSTVLLSEFKDIFDADTKIHK